MRGVWVDQGQAVQAAKLRAAGITAPYFSHRDPNVTAAYLAQVAAGGFSPGLYTAWNWYPTLTPDQYAETVDSELRRIAWKGNAPLCIDIEEHDPDYVLRFFARWRQLRPTRQTAFTFEGFQGGMLAPVIPQLLRLHLRFVPQLYDGDMTPLEHSPVLDLISYGVPGDLIDGFYDAAALPYNWRGFAFTQARLP